MMPFRSHAIDGLLAWMAAGMASGVTLVGSAAMLSPSGEDLAKIADKAPDPWTSAIMLVVAVVAKLMRDSNLTVTAESRNTLLSRIESLAYETRTGTKEVALEASRFRQELAEKVGGIGATVNEIRTNQHLMGAKVENMGERMTKVELAVRGVQNNCDTVTQSGGHL